jgi:hypothetical protein
MTQLSSGKMVLNSDHELRATAAFDWDIDMPSASGAYEVALSTEATPGSEGALWARFIDPRFE